MINSELSRLLLSYYAVHYEERPHIFGWASLFALWHAGTLEIPVIYGKKLRLVGPRSIVDHFDKHCPDHKSLLPSEPILRRQVESDWLFYNGDVGANTASFAYFHLLPHRVIMFEPFTRGCPKSEANLLSFGYPVLKLLFTVLLGLNAEKAGQAIIQVRQMIDSTDELLSDGRQYLRGERLTLSDFTLTTAIAPLLLPEGFGSPMPRLNDMPALLVKTVLELREHPTAEYVQRIYDEFRDSRAFMTLK